MKNSLFFFLLCFGVTLNAQSELWSRKVSKGAFISQLDDGKILLNENTKISLIDNTTGEIKWQKNIATQDEPEFLDALPILFFEGKSYAVIDATTGNLIDSSNEKTNILSISYFWNLGRVVLELERNKNLHILNIDLKNLSKSWNTKVGPVQKRLKDPSSRISENRPEISNDGLLVVTDKRYISVLNSDGTILNKVEFKKNLQTLGFNHKLNVFYVLENKQKIHFININSPGKEKVFISFVNKNPQLKILGDGSNISIVKDNQIRVLDGVNAAEKGNSVFDDKIKSAYVDEESGRLFVLTPKELNEIDHSNGSIINSISFKKKFKAIYNIYGKTILSGSSGACPFDLNTFAFEYPIILDIPTVHDYVEMGNYIGYIYFYKEKFKLHVIDNNGALVWKKSYHTINAPSLDVIGNGLLIFSDSKVVYLDIETGKSIWNDKVNVDPSFTYGIDEMNNDLYMYSKKRLYKFDYSNGILSKSEDKFRFKDFDYETLQPQLFVLPDNIFMKGSNTIFVLDKKGVLQHKKTYPRISNGSTIFQLANVIITAVAIGTGNANEVFDQGGLVDLLDANFEIAYQMNYNRRARQNRGSIVLPYVFTKLENGKRGLVFINPSDGAERFSIELDEKNPSYIVDEIDGVLFHLSKQSLSAYDLK